MSISGMHLLVFALLEEPHDGVHFVAGLKLCIPRHELSMLRPELSSLSTELVILSPKLFSLSPTVRPILIVGPPIST